MTVTPIEAKVLKENDRTAADLRREFKARGLLCLNFIGAPGSGKTALLEQTLLSLPRESRVAVLTGDVQTDNDARRIARAGFPVKQIATDASCQLDAAMVAHALHGWDLDNIDLLLIENVGNLACPSSVDLGEQAKIVLLSVPEGDDKPEKYPGVYRRAELMLITKSDLLPYVDFDIVRACSYAQRAHPGMRHIILSSRTGDGMSEWRQWLSARRHTASSLAAVHAS